MPSLAAWQCILKGGCLVVVQGQLQSAHLMRSSKRKFQILNGVSGILKPVRAAVIQWNCKKSQSC